jgi:CRISPR/Cas system-associated exonuclease Cas4 (RecB family)
MAAIPQPQNTTSQAVYGLHAARAAAEQPRTYLGWSEIGAECDRALWYGFRHVGRLPLNGQSARLFDTGRREEDRLLQELRDLGYEVWDRDERGEQFGVASVGGHLRGHLDAIVRGLPEAPKTAHVVDVKTIKTKKFDELLKKGMRALYPKYWAQGHGYMGRMKLERAAFIFVCKDDDRIHVERVEFDRAEFERYEQRAERIVRSIEPPLRVSDDPEFFVCRFCDFKHVCHAGAVPAVNCRTCAHATPALDGDGDWQCGRAEVRQHMPGAIPIVLQRTGCTDHLYIPPLLAKRGDPVDATDDSVTYRAADGSTFVNGRGGLTSPDLRDYLAAP